jgi:large subunit ribosomal protein L21
MAKVAKKDEFAVFLAGGKQHKVSVGDVLKVEKIIGEHKEGDSLTFDKVLLVDNGADTTVGTPYISGAQITATLKKIARYPTVRVVRYKQKSRYHKENGHRQPYFEIEITGIK